MEFLSSCITPHNYFSSFLTSFIYLLLSLVMTRPQRIISQEERIATDHFSLPACRINFFRAIFFLFFFFFFFVRRPLSTPLLSFLFFARFIILRLQFCEIYLIPLTYRPIFENGTFELISFTLFPTLQIAFVCIPRTLIIHLRLRPSNFIKFLL